MSRNSPATKGAAKRHAQSGYLARIKGLERQCRDCGNSFAVGTQPWTCGRCHSLRATPDSNERGPQAKSYKRLRVRLLEEATHCALCNDLLGGVRPDPLAPEIDHIIQRVDGGGNEESNLRVVHNRCNNAWARDVVKYRLAAARGALFFQAAGL